MRPAVDAAGIRAFARELGRVARHDTKLYLTGGATAVLRGWRAATLDIDVRFEPESDELLRAIARLKHVLGGNVKLASPPDFVPGLPGWRERSPFVLREGRIEVHHDVDAMLREGLVNRDRLSELFADAERSLFRYPAIDAGSFRANVEQAIR